MTWNYFGYSVTKVNEMHQKLYFNLQSYKHVSVRYIVQYIIKLKLQNVFFCLLNVEDLIYNNVRFSHKAHTKVKHVKENVFNKSD